ncbi:MAG: CHAT domain-containing protein, partial [Leptolyngbya sp. SIO4C1]|nr:CHAT domain-containing protein [Leptolyngbya sp. SIO4C1]
QLGSVLRRIGDLETARSRLQESVSLAARPETLGSSWLELGNTDWAIANRLAAIGREADAQQQVQVALAAYQQAIDQTHLLQAQLNRLRLLIEQGQTLEARQSLSGVLATLDQQSPSRATVYATIHLMESLMQLTADPLPPLEIASRLSKAADQARTLADRPALSYALGQLGALYEHTQQWAEAQALTQQALLALDTVQAPEIRYRWQWQLGRLLQRQGHSSEAVQAYEAAVGSLQQVRNDLLSVNAEVQFSFRDRVEPVYRQYLELLLTPEQTAQPQQLTKAIQTVDQLQLAELENYLSCLLGQVQRVDQVQDAHTAILYPIVLSDRVAVIAQLPETALVYRETAVPQAVVEATLLDLQTNLATPGRTPEVLAAAQTVYDWLIRPLETDLAQAAVNNLVFVLEGTLRNIPMSVLHDGDQYLIEQGYAVAIAPRLQLFSPDPAPLQVMLGGVGIPQVIQETQFPPIAKLQEELAGIAQHVDSSDLVMNEAFTTETIREYLQTGNFSAIHWKTHGVFSSDPQETYVVAYQEQIGAYDLNHLIWLGSRGGSRPLELVTLSACETAQGDSRAVLGLAGLAARTGTRSVLSTLWVAQDNPNTLFMVRFYQALAQGVAKAEAVRQAQLALMQAYGYTTPHIWSNYLLIGNWG